jgi:hypothetical protein
VAVVLVLAAIAVLTAGCSGNGDDNNDSASRNSSNFSTRSIVAFGREVPTMSGATSVTRGTLEGGAWHRTYEVDATGDAILAFYRKELPSSGWTDDQPPSTTPGGTQATWRRTGLRLDVTVAPAGAEATPTSGTGTATSTVNLSLTRTGDR